MRVIAVFHDNDIYSGATRSFLSNVKYLKEKGIDVYAIVPQKKGNLVEQLEYIGVKSIRGFYGGVTYRKGSNVLSTVFRYYIGVMKLLISSIWCLVVYFKFKNVKIDWVYTNTSTLYIGSQLAFMLDSKHIWHFREFGYLDQSFNRVFPMLFKYLVKKSNNIIMISNALKEFYRKEFNICDNVSMIYNDIVIENKIKKEKHDGLNVLITGTISEGKGQKLALEAMKKIKEEDIRLYIAGQVNDYAKKLIKYAKKEKITNVEFCGFVKDMNSLRSKIDIALVCSKNEAFGRTIIEDMASGILVIGNNAGAVPELISGKVGLIFKENSVNDLVEKLLFAKRNWNDMVNVINAARIYSNSFTKERCAREIYKIITQ
ncbi:putative glycosyl transferase family 4 protein [Selenomonas ruminantium subsp. lactilytica TAM6421]|uniref:Putative glycosyl transferase family 4 protein n=1 Tax=Selenomonas ruminantium subsp. lactilytica (strain NBRC 103574 / TAM6421) TaxID=927704 RepID=I0GRQ1_SELRL|nr:glycosyltransferase family 4 protein [Selenomonas ruminantium]BAL83438.1 putative glycosyl transferase family 4 protein [Selenomonas ruminantium subsp. lactilytica TAM6421]